ncbi:MAG: sugar transferase [Actinomycetota bacterium]|nr:sugar transferase [Actinomycetota bacterium]
MPVAPESRRPALTPPARTFKRAVDVLVGGALLVATLPIQALTALAILLDDGSPVLYRQDRAGRHGAPFTVFKFRSMRVHQASPADIGQVGAGHPLITRVGRVIRRSKLDEVPQLWNVVRGSMSLVGPRPALRESAATYDGYQRRRLLVRPGMTGWGQVNGGPTVSWDDRIVLDVWYVDHWSPWLDLRILLLTLSVILLGERPRPEAIAQARSHEAEERAATATSVST